MTEHSGCCGDPADCTENCTTRHIWKTLNTPSVPWVLTENDRTFLKGLRIGTEEEAK